MSKIAIIAGSTRPGQKSTAVAQWVLENAKKRTDAQFEVINIADFHLPLLDEPVPPSMGQYSQAHTKKWSEVISKFDGYILVTPEYNHSTSAALKNALDFLYKEWNNKAVGFVSYGAAGGTRAVEHLRGIASELQLADVRQAVHLSLITDFENYSVFKPNPQHETTLKTLLDQLISWSGALQKVRS